MTKHIEFEKIILQNGDIDAAYIEFPFSTSEVFGKKGRIKVKAVFDDLAEYRGSLVKMGSERHLLILTKEIRAKIKKSFGDKVKIKLWEDTEDRKVEIPEDILELFKENEKEYAVFQKMSFTHQKEYIFWINEAKKIETRQRRKMKMIEILQQKIRE
ncbi:MAG: YdeI/OmpD-associated family protein [Capnocytophaga sp.]|nr:YdeI/OmpD-associated family protein [Capnocytophaga sp.]